jgi:hypothetical protein
MQIVTEEQIKKALEEAGIEIKENCFYELDDVGFGKVINFPRSRTRLRIHEIDGETKVSYICGINKINKKKLTYTDRYTGCLHWVVKPENLIDAMWLDCNKFTVIENLRACKNADLFKRIAKELEE